MSSSASAREVEAVHTPGHTWGHLALFDPRSATAEVAGEASMARCVPDTLPHAPTYCYVDTYLATQEYTVGHANRSTASAQLAEKMTQPEVREYIAESRQYVLHVEAALLDYSRRHPDFTLRGAVDELGPTLGRWPAATNQDFSYGMAGNLESLTKRGPAPTERNAAGLITWRPL